MREVQFCGCFQGQHRQDRPFGDGASRRNALGDNRYRKAFGEKAAIEREIMAKESIAITESNESIVVKELKEIIKQKDDIIAALNKHIDVLLKAPKVEVEEIRTPTMKISQINMGSKRYFCKTPQEQEIFRRKHPNARMETFEIELPLYVAQEYLDDPENKKEFTENKDGGRTNIPGS